MFDFATRDTNKLSAIGVEMDVYDLRDDSDGDLIEGVKITVFGPESEAYRGAVREFGRKQKLYRKGGMTMADSSEMSAGEDLEVAVACTKSWKGVGEDGKELPCDEKTKREFYIKYPWVRGQVVAHVRNRINFLPKSGKAG